MTIVKKQYCKYRDETVFLRPNTTCYLKFIVKKTTAQRSFKASNTRNWTVIM